METGMAQPPKTGFANNRKIFLFREKVNQFQYFLYNMKFAKFHCIPTNI